MPFAHYKHIAGAPNYETPLPSGEVSLYALSYPIELGRISIQ